ncbi:hypothetical protein C8R47DRAFT_590684 [Mycena vitilis]|nr:hypothetical protein C8R47DRAFT_590684 [Mycena vitilis]
MSTVHPHTPFTSTTSSSMRLLVPMPVPRTPNAPYFDQRGVTDFLNLILQHGSNAGIDDADDLVSFIVHYSSDRVREVIQYIPEIDVDEPNRTWSAAREQMLLLYGSSDQRRVSEPELIEFCRQQSAKSSYRTKQDIEQYLRDFQWIAAPLLKQHDITIKQRDFYFVSGIPRSVKQWFISRVPEHQRARSNPIPLADSLGILYGYFDPDTLFPDVWNTLDNRTVPVVSSSPPPAPTCAPPSMSNLASAISARLQLDIQPLLPSTAIAMPQVVISVPDSPQPDVAPMLSPESMIPFHAQDTPEALQLDEHYVDLDSGDIQHEDPTAEDNFEVLPSADDIDCVEVDEDVPQDDIDAEVRSQVLPSDEIPDGILRRVDLCAGGGHRIIDCPVKESPVYFCGTHELADNDPAEPFYMDGPTIPHCSELIFANTSTEEKSNLARFFAELLQQHVSQMSSSLPLDDTDNSTVTGSDVESLFDFVARSEMDLDTDMQSSFSFDGNTDSGSIADTNSSEYEPPLRCDARFSELTGHSPPRDAEVDEPATATAGSSHNSHDDIQHVLRTPFEFYTEPLSPHEPFTRAEPFFSCASYVDYFVPELFELESEICSGEPPHPTDIYSADDAPPSYQESMSAPTSRVVYGRPRIKAEFTSLISTWMFVCLSLLARGFCTMISTARAFVFEKVHFEIQVLSFCKPRDDIGSTAIKIIEDDVPPDKTSEHSSTCIAFGAEYFCFVISCLFPCWNLFSRARMKVEAEVHTDSQDDRTLQGPDVEVMYEGDRADDSTNFSGQDDIELRGDAVPPDKSILPSSPDPFPFAKYSIASQLIFPFSQDFEDEI